MNLIVAPHIDDEVIGCWNILKRKEKKNTHIIYVESMEKERKKEAENASKMLKFSYELTSLWQLRNTILDWKEKGLKDYIVFVPDPLYEIHPAHRLIGNLTLRICQEENFRIITYSTAMNAPYIKEIDDPDKKRWTLNLLYASQKQLWKYDYKYWLFEGLCEWNPNV